jgi:CDP-paratose 2-epimerase
MSIDELMSIDQTKHSVFGASKVAADIMCQEYGRYFGLNVGVFRGGCLTGPNHAGAELHGFLSYLTKCIVHDKPYTIFGYKGKQVRDNIHSFDLVNMFWHFHQNPKQGAVYNAGGGRENSTSILEAIATINRLSGKSWTNYTVSEQNRIGDHIWYISDLSKFKDDYPGWDISISLEETIQQMIDFELK